MYNMWHIFLHDKRMKAHANLLMTTTMPNATACMFTELENGIWVFKFLESSTKAVDEWLDWQEYFINTAPLPEDNIARMVIDIRQSGLPPFLYTMQQARAWRGKHPEVEAILLKVAMVTKTTGALQQRYANLIKDGVNVFGMKMVKVELFPAAFDEAVAWLLQSDD
jgi:hypothetical protein